MKVLIKNYAGFLIGLVFGSTVATLVTYSILYDPGMIATTLHINDCLIEKLQE